jgi:glycosyltransferase involved in cell wall biosynthesis
MKLSIIIPAYNEEKRLSETLWNYFSFFQQEFENDFEIIVIPNNCSDRTFEVVKSFAEKFPQIKAFNIPYYVGKGGAVLKGFELARGDYIGFVDADQSTSPVNFFKLYQNKKNFSGIIASRKIRGAIISPKRTSTQTFSSFIFNILTRTLFGLKYKDTQCGAKLFKKETAKFLAKICKETGWAFDVSLLSICQKNNFEILEYPIRWTDSEGSKLNFFGGLRATLSLFKIRFNVS